MNIEELIEVIEVNLNQKYVIQINRPLEDGELNNLIENLTEFVRNDSFPFLILLDDMKLVKISE